MGGIGLMEGHMPGRRDLLAWYVACSASLIGRAGAEDAAKVTAPIQRFYAGLLSVMQAGRTTPFIQRFRALAPILEQALNVPAILKSAVGSRWATIPAPQQSVLLTAFTRYTVSTWVGNFDSYSGQKLEVKGSRPMGSAHVVHTEIVKQSGSPSVIDYVMRPANAGWKATDVLLDGSISQVAVLRSDFRSLLARGPLALVAHLEQKATELARNSGLPPISG